MLRLTNLDPGRFPMIPIDSLVGNATASDGRDEVQARQGTETKPRAPFGSAVFVGTARNCARYLPAALERWAAMSRLFRRADFIIAENDSVDATKSMLPTWSAGGPHRRVLCLDGIGCKGELRSVVLATVRNRLLEVISNDPRLRSADYLVVMDMDDASLAITPERLRRCMLEDGWDGLFANQLFYYNDVWALRANARCTDDWVERVAAAPEGVRRGIARLRYLTWRNRPIWPFGRRIPVRSAFGGFAVYRMPIALESRYEGLRNGREICEHVPYNEHLADRGARLFLHPRLINMLPLPLYNTARGFGLL